MSHAGGKTVSRNPSFYDKRKGDKYSDSTLSRTKSPNNAQPIGNTSASNKYNS